MGRQCIDFITVTNTTEDQREKQKHVEYASRFLVYLNIDYDGKLDIEEYIDHGLLQLANSKTIDQSVETFTATFSMLNLISGKNSLRRIAASTATGRVGWAAFECIAIGIAKNIEHIKQKKDPKKFVKNRITAFWQSNELEKFFSPGLTGTTRIQRTIPFGESWFSK